MQLIKISYLSNEIGFLVKEVIEVQSLGVESLSVQATTFATPNYLLPTSSQEQPIQSPHQMTGQKLANRVYILPKTGIVMTQKLVTPIAIHRFYINIPIPTLC